MYKLLKFDLGRNALKYIVNEYNIKELHIPYYLCDVIRHSLFEVGCKPVFYHIDDNFYPQKIFGKDEFILYPNYFGICGKNVAKITELYKNVIVDNAHAYYDAPSGFATFNVGNKFGYRNALLWLKDENVQENYKIEYREKDKIKRKEIFIDLHQKYGETNLLNINTDSIPFVYPYLARSVELADKLVKELNKEGKTVYRYWNSLPTNFNEYKFFTRLVPIPILPDVD